METHTAHLFDYEIDLKHKYNQICIACGYRFGEHYRGGQCDRDKLKDLRDSYKSYTGTYFTPSGVFSVERFVCHSNLIGHRMRSNPNAVFKVKRRSGF